MKNQWLEISSKFQKITTREQVLIMTTAIVVIVMLFYTFSIDRNMIKANGLSAQTRSLNTTSIGLKSSITELEAVLKEDPNAGLIKQIARYESELAKVDTNLLTLTSDLINPIQMRQALLKLLDLQRGVSLLSFELIGVKPLVTSEINDEQNDKNLTDTEAKVSSENTLNLYRHGIRIKLSGGYFQLRDYLQQLEGISWTFFWQGFRYEVKEYPNSELEIEIYSLSTKREFIGV